MLRTLTAAVVALTFAGACGGESPDSKPRMQKVREVVRGDDLWLWPGERRTKRNIERDKAVCVKKSSKDPDLAREDQLKLYMRCMSYKGWELDQEAWKALVEKRRRQNS